MIGFNDVGYHSNTDTLTPFIDNLALTESIRIERHYVLPSCTVSRCALLTGRYPMRYGMQDGIISYESSYALSRQETLISNEFKSQGYDTHMIGKWHLGMRTYDYVPNNRGFDTFLGYYGPLIDYYTHYGNDGTYSDRIDFHLNEDGYDEPNKYSLYIYKDYIINLLKEKQEKKKKK